MIQVLAHRGFSARYPENTLLSFEKALDIGADGVEFDVQLTKDGVPVILHDENLLRTAGADLFVKDLSLEALRGYDVSARFSGAVPPQRVPTLAEYFQLVADRDFLTNIELKNAVYPYPGIEAAVIDLIRQYRLSDRVILSSFNHESLLRVKALAPELPCGILYECRIARPQQYAKNLNFQYLHPWEIFLDDAALDACDAAGILANPWTVDDPARMRYFFERRGVYSIITNRPDLALSLREGRP